MIKVAKYIPVVPVKIKTSMVNLRFLNHFCIDFYFDCQNSTNNIELLICSKCFLVYNLNTCHRYLFFLTFFSIVLLNCIYYVYD